MHGQKNFKLKTNKLPDNLYRENLWICNAFHILWGTESVTNTISYGKCERVANIVSLEDTNKSRLGFTSDLESLKYVIWKIKVICNPQEFFT